ncbi:Multidrug resistance protein 1 [Talaromyces islandicus]|uniref:Multidrug resistance protein 1 n=1 Tax=Talaromyces islandicus TaxID=28573 RepID=A0A0U1LWX2_TALIS|nr:Multidrug resistance protein 1 [Talaromyces islandicus]
MSSVSEAQAPGEEEKKGRVLETEEQKAILDRQLYGLQDGTAKRKLGPWTYANQWDYIVLTLSSIAGIAAGAANPLLVVIFGQLADTFTGFENGSKSGATLRSQTNKFALYYVYLAVAEFVLIYTSTVGFYWSGDRIVRRMRRAYLKAIIRQNMSFFDTLGIGKVTSHITSDMTTIQEALTSKLSIALYAASNFCSAFIIAFIFYPRLAGILCSILVAMIMVTTATTRFAVKNDKISKKFYSTAASIAQEAIMSIRHVTAYGSQKQLADRYEGLLRGAEKSGVKSRVYVALLIGWSSAMPCFTYALGWYAGGKYLSQGHTTVSAVVSSTVAIVNGSFAMVRVIPTMENFVSSITSATATFEIIERQSPQDPFSTAGETPASVEGNIELKGVEVVYPSRKDTKVLKGVDISIPALKTTALVGLSGCGKSTILGLLERFYEPTAGSVRLDGHELQNLNLQWLRSQMAYVGQEPTLFSTSVYENIRHGLINSGISETPEQTKERVIAAAKLASAHDFISTLPNGYDTEVGEKGISLSGGQRQRIAIARAVVSGPKILLLDEATSALDTRSEKAVQQALDNASKGRTTVVIAHRLSTIRNADNIIVMQAGEVMEQGTHSVLLAQNGIYADLVQKQQVVDSDGDAGSESESDEKVQIQRAESRTNPNVGEKGAGNSATSIEGEGDLAKKNEPKPSLWLAMKVILKLNHQERWLLLGGMVMAFFAGFTLLLQAIWFAEVLNAYSLTDIDRMVSQVNLWSLLFTMTGIYAFIVAGSNGIFFAISTERLARRVRDVTLRSILRQNIGFFDDKAHGTGLMASKLSSSSSDLSGLGGAVMGCIMTFTATIAISLILCLAVGWKLSLVCAAVIPLLTALGWVRMEFISVFDGKIRLAGERAATYASEAVGAIRTVASGGLEGYVLDSYREIQAEQAAKSLPAILRASAFYAVSQGINFLAAALVFWYGSGLLASGEYTLKQYYICFIGLIWGSGIAGSLFNFSPDMSKAAHAACDLKKLFDRVPEIDSWNESGEHMAKETCQGHLKFEKVSFAYPSRPDTTVLHDLDLDIPAGKFVALVGASGSGKTTVLGLLERFYDATRGTITLDGQDISRLNLNEYRHMFSLVSQEPAVYSGTIRENLTTGLDPNKPVTEEDIIAACKDANIYNFITSLPEGFETEVGSSGSMLSGGQKQRLTIARALLRAAPILILDEATAALDSDSEKLVQEALNATSRGRTTVAIAHRLSSIQHADIIYMLDRGQVVEKGSHAELIKKRGAYYKMVQIQGL